MRKPALLPAVSAAARPRAAPGSLCPALPSTATEPPLPPHSPRNEPAPGGAGERGRAGPEGRRRPAGHAPGEGFCRCCSSSASSSTNSNHDVCGGVHGRLEVAASRSAASALMPAARQGPPPTPQPRSHRRPHKMAAGRAPSEAAREGTARRDAGSAAPWGGPAERACGRSSLAPLWNRWFSFRSHYLGACPCLSPQPSLCLCVHRRPVPAVLPVSPQAGKWLTLHAPAHEPHERVKN